MIKKTMVMVLALILISNVVGSGGYADQKYSNISELASVIVELEQKSKNQEDEIKELLSKTTDEQKTIQAIEKNVKSLVKIESTTEIGSGFFVKDDIILTAYHVVHGSDMESIKVTMYNGDLLKGEVINYDNKHDLAIIKVDGSGTPVTISNNINVGQTAISYGFPMGINATANKGIVSAVNDDIQVSTPINNGDSGGMLLDSNGDVIGLIKSRLASVPNGAERAEVYLVGYATSASDILVFMKRIK